MNQFRGGECLLSTNTINETSVSVKEPDYFLVLLHNDDFTPRDFVVDLLATYFSMDQTLAEKTMLTAHIKGKAACGRFSLEIAETKVEQVEQVIKSTTYPLQFTVEPA